jgi:hypothetical protein
MQMGDFAPKTPSWEGSAAPKGGLRGGSDRFKKNSRIPEVLNQVIQHYRMGGFPTAGISPESAGAEQLISF